MGIVYKRFHLDLKNNFDENFVNEKFIVPENCIFALGDNRHDSKDSTYYGAFQKDDVLGIVELERDSQKGRVLFYWDYVMEGKFFTTIGNCF
jgi:hypothetical protein